MLARPLIGLAIAASLIASPAVAAGLRQRFSVPPGTLLSTLGTFARAAGIDISFNSELARVASPGLTGTFDVKAGLDRLLGGTPYAARLVAPDSYRIVRRPPAPVLAAVALPTVDTGGGDIVVTGGKRNVTLANYPGSAIVIVPGEDGTGPYGSGGQSSLLRRSPILQSTELGRGRNKLFIRGVADSSFTGPTQATAGTYFGDVRTGYSGPDPSLNLFDVASVEILEGPQGALYGAGSIGGVIRLAPRAPAINYTEGLVEGGVSMTAHGAPSYDAAAMINLTPWADHGAFRLVAYRSVAGGFIDDPGRRVSDVNRMTETGARAAVRFESGDGWSVDAGGVIQQGRQPDLQYATRGAGSLIRLSRIAQPFKDDYKLGRLVIAREWDSGLRLFSATGRAYHDTDQRFDATAIALSGLPLAYDEQNFIRLTTQEVRLSRSLPGGDSWLMGASYIHNTTGKTREFGRLDSQRELIGVTNRTNEKAIFASATKTIFGALSVTGGGRYTHARMDGSPSTVSRTPFIAGQSSGRIDPQLGLSLRLNSRLAMFAQYQQGFRTGGLAVAPGARVATYMEDRIRVGEVGVRLVRQGATGIAAVAAISYARWSDIQADLVSNLGFPYTANVGDGRIAAFEATTDWVPFEKLRLRASLFLNRSRLVNPQAGFLSSGSRPLPATPPVSATTSISWTTQLAGAPLKLDANARYVGRSRIGVGPLLDLPYGDYVETGAAATLQLEAMAIIVSIDNLLDTRGNRFAIGNPFGVVNRDERTPLRPRTARVGARIGF